ncbi:uncharacterized protein VTP21DRAFT_4405 [Calcarisporiella thermophila]|uniref:uncharacterized protein n=1 Tax=Calcarisporiella thermophila TaxID=911321 RepID=UPI0037448C3D
MAFSSGLILTDLNDYIAPSQACIKPVEVKKTRKDGDPMTSIQIDNAGTYYEVSQDGGQTRLETASITLNDCLACSGCITSAESVLVSMQSHEELYKILQNNRLAFEEGRSNDISTVVISISPQSRASIAARHRLSPQQVARRLTWFLKQLGVHYVLDTSFSRDFSLVESAREFVDRYRKNRGAKQTSEVTMDLDDGLSRPQRSSRRANRTARAKEEAELDPESALPMLASACPGWICYAEKTHGYVLPYISRTKSPQQIMGSLVKDYLAGQLGLRPNQIYHVCVMPCYDKKLEASREDFYNSDFDTREVDCVITTGELEKMLEEQQVDLAMCEEVGLDGFSKVCSDPNTQEALLLGTPGNPSGGYLEFILAYAARELFHIEGVDATREEGGVTIRTVRNADFREVTLERDGQPLLRFAAAYGFRNIQNVIRKMKTGRASAYDYVEVMACPSGCINGGGQLKPPEQVPAKDWVAQVDAIYRSVPGASPEENGAIGQLYEEWLGGSSTHKAHRMLRTQYRALEQEAPSGLAVKW